MTGLLNGKVALVTGGSRGLGAAIAEALAAGGADVAISYVSSAEKAEAVVARLRGRVRAAAFRSDAGDVSAARPLVEAVVAEFGRLDILVNNAAIAVQGKLTDDPAIDTEGLDRQWRVNVLGPVATTRAAAQRMADGGRIVFIGSGLGTRIPFAGVADYAATKAAVLAYAKGVARDLGRRDIAVSVVQPGIMPTDMAAAAAANIPEAIMDLHAVRRIATLEEVAAGVCFLAGPHGAYMSGTVLDVSGGFQI